MLYRLYLYGTTAGTGKAPCLEDINHVLDTQSAKAWNNGNEPADFLAEFDVESVLSRIRNELGDKCKAHIDYPDKPANQVAYLFVGTSYQKVHEVLPRLYAIAAEYRLALYDAEKHKGYYKTLVDEALISMKLRAQAIILRILDENEPVWEISQISSYCEEHQVKSSSFVVTLRKTADSSFQERTRRFYETLVKAIAQDEKLICENRCFTVEGSWYSITFCLEGYKKHPNMIGFYENWEEGGDGYRIKNEPEQFLYEHRYDVAHLYDVFIQWSQMQLRYYDSDRMFNIEGP